MLVCCKCVELMCGRLREGKPAGKGGVEMGFSCRRYYLMVVFEVGDVWGKLDVGWLLNDDVERKKR